MNGAPSKSSFARLSSIAFVGLLASSTAFSAGFEKSMTWSGKAVGQGGAVVGTVSGAEALYFNPAGLARANGKMNTDAIVKAPTPEGTAGAGGTSDTNGEVSLNFSPTLSKFEGPAPFANTASRDGKTGFSPVVGAVAAYQLSPKLGVGLGYYVSGGTKSKYENLDFTGLNPNFNSTRPTIETNLAITELGLGLGYEIIPGLSVGASWRPTMVKADFSTVSYVQNAALLNVFVDNLSKTRWNGYKLGLQYSPEGANWGLGLGYRSRVSFIAKTDKKEDFHGTIENATASGNATAVGTSDSASIGNVFPEQAVAGAYVKPSDNLRVAVEYSFTHYSLDHQLGLQGQVTAPAGTLGATAVPIPLRNITQDWKNQHVARIGSQYAFSETTVGRIGYAWTSQVTADEFARSTFASPGSGHAVTLGGGHACMSNLDLDAALEYSWASGKGTNKGLAASPSPLVAATAQEVATSQEFKSHAYVLHLGATYRF